MQLSQFIRTTPNPFKIPWIETWLKSVVPKIETYNSIKIGAEPSIEGLSSALMISKVIKAFWGKDAEITFSLKNADISIPPSLSGFTHSNTETVVETYLSSLALVFSRTNFFNQTFVAVDLETAGYPQQEEEIVEIGAAKFVNGILIDTYQSLVKPGKPITRDAFRIHGISNEEVEKYGKNPREALHELADFVGNSAIVGHNARDFDLFILINNARKYAPELIDFYEDKKNSLVDTLLLSRRYYPEAPSRRLGELAKYLNIENNGRYHRALTDAIVSGEILFRMAFSYMLPSARILFERWTFFDVTVPILTLGISNASEIATEESLLGWKELKVITGDPSKLLLYSRYPNLRRFIRSHICKRKNILPFMFRFTECPEEPEERNRLYYSRVLPELKRAISKGEAQKILSLFNFHSVS